MKNCIFINIFLIFCIAGNAQKSSPALIFKKYSSQNKTAPSYFYVVKIPDSSPLELKKLLRVKAKRQLTGSVFIIDTVLLNNISQQKESIERIEPANNYWKLSTSAEAIISAGKNNHASFNFYIQFADTSSFKKIFAPGTHVKKLFLLADKKIIAVVCSYEEIETIFLNDDEVIFIDVIQSKPVTELGTPGYDLSANKINLVHSQYPSINGAGQHVSIKEDYYDTTDIDLKGRMEISPLASARITNHANFMATIIAGAGNSVYYAKGAAWQSTISSSSFEQVLPDANDAYQLKNITVQNHSYGTEIDNNYGLNAVAFDKSANENPNLLHVFSSGNSGTDSSTNNIYAGIEGYANLTGNFKMAKNILTVGAVDSLGNLVLQSSAGPAYDGRIKPDLVAFQQNGTSEAAALVSGTTLLLQQFYKNLYGSNLTSALAKAILINTADDIGNTGPDYKTGYGNLNAIKAMNLVRDNKILSGNISQDDKQSFIINIPENIQRLKITLAWNDTAATAASPKALMNDLDLEVNFNGKTWQPWVLNSFANIDSLKLPALRKRDSLNNVEQVTIENPAAGDYKINISGYDLSTSHQQYFVAYSWDSLNYFKWEKPAGIDFAEANTQSILRWQNSFSGNGDVEYSLGDNKWIPLATGVDLSKNYFYWKVPDSVSPAVVRMKIGNNYFYSDTFLITKLLTPTTGFVCGDSILLYWNKIKNINQYQLYRLGEKYMEPFLTVNDTTAVISKNNLSNTFIAVAPVLNNGMVEQKSYAFDFTKQGAGCFINSFYAEQDEALAKLNLTMGTLINVAAIVFEKMDDTGYTVIASPVVAGRLQYQENYSPLKKGITNFRVRLILKNGQVIYSNREAVFYSAPGEYVLFPVPVKRNNDITVISSLPDGEIISLLDITGRLVLKKRIIAAKDFIKTTTLQSGIYFYRVTKKGTTLASGKLIVL
jgi:Subtilase family/Secretion system C-terminal sorting domain